MLYAFAAMLVSSRARCSSVRWCSRFPGPVAGMILLAALMAFRAPLPSGLGDTADGLLKHLSLLFVPAGVGVVQHLDLLGSEGARLMAVVVLSTAITLAVTALVFAGVARLMGRRAEDDGSRERP